MLIAVLAISLAIGFVVAAGVVGSQAHRLGRQRREPVWRLAEAANYISDLLRYDVAAGLTTAQLEVILRAHLNQLQFGLPTAPHSEGGLELDAGADDGPDAASARGTDFATPAVREEQALVTDLYRAIRRDGHEVTLEQVTAVSEAHVDYLQRIGALAVVHRNGR